VKSALSDFDPVECVYRAISHRLNGMTYPQFQLATMLWEFVPISHQGRTCGAIMKNGMQVHIAIEPESQSKKWLRGVMRKELSKVIDEYGMAETQVMESHEVGHRLAKLLGFERARTVGGIVTYQCTEMAV